MRDADLQFTYKEEQPFIDKYCPKLLKDFVGNAKAIKKALKVAKDFRLEKRSCEYGAILLTGPGGIGKSTLAKFIAESRGMFPILISATATRKKEEIERFEMLYKSKIRNLLRMNHPAIKKILEKSNMGPGLPIGKCIIVDEIECTMKGERGLLTPLTRIIKSSINSTNDTLIIVTLDTQKIKKYSSLRRWCCEVQLKSPSESECLKVVNRVCDGEKWKLSKPTRQAFARNCQGDLRRLLNEMQLFFTDIKDDNISSVTVPQVNEYFKNKQLRVRDMTSVGVLNILIDEELNIENNDVYDYHSQERKLALIETDGYTIPLYLFDTYPRIVKQPPKAKLKEMAKKRVIGKEYLTKKDIVMDSLANASDDFSYADVMYNKLKSNDPGAFSEEKNPDPDFHNAHIYRIEAVLKPLSHINTVIPHNYRVDVSTSSKFFGSQSTQRAQAKLPMKLGGMVNGRLRRTREEWIVLRDKLFSAIANDEKWDEIIREMHENNIPVEILDEIVKIKCKSITDDCKAGQKRYAGNMKKKFKRRYQDLKPEPQGLKFQTKKPKKIINMFGNY